MGTGSSGAPYARSEDHDGPNPDVELIEAARTGRTEEFGKLVARYQTLVCSLAYALTGDIGVSEEIAQETFLVAWKRLPTFQTNLRFRSWLYGITRNVVRNSRRRARGSFPIRGDVPSVQPSALEQIITQEEERVLWRVLGQIPESYRVPLVLFYREGRRIEEVAETLNLSSESVRQRLTRGRRMLHDQLVELIEPVLLKTRPGKGFAVAVVAAITASAAAEASAAPAGKTLLGGASTKTLALATGAAVLLTVAAAGTWRLINAGPMARRQPIAHAATPAAPRLASLEGPAAFAEALPGGALVPSGAIVPEDASPSTTLFSFDFEDGVLPDVMDEGHLVPGPPRARNRYAVLGTISTLWGKNLSVTVGRSAARSTLFHYADTMAVSFDYWIANECMGLQMFDNDQDQNYAFSRCADVTSNKWAHGEARLVDFVPSKYKARKMENGDSIRDMVITGSRVGTTLFYVDNVKILNRQSVLGMTSSFILPLPSQSIPPRQ